MITARIEPGTRLAAIVGPTAVGKTTVALRIAGRLNAEIISVDAMQVYRGMDIGTGKPTPEERKAVPFHMLDIVEPSDTFSVARFKELADNEVFVTASRGKIPLLVGGSGLYYRAVVDYLDFANTSGTDLYRVEVVEELEEMDDVELHDLLSDLDRASATEIPPSNRRRVLRAIEVAREGDRLMSEHQHSWADFESPYNGVAAGLDMDREALYRLIEERVDSMVERGLVGEVENLAKCGLARGTTAGEALGYRQLLSYFDGECTLDEAVDEIKRRTRNYAKRQRTWFHADPRIKWFTVRAERKDPSSGLAEALDEAAEAVLEYLAQNLEN